MAPDGEKLAYINPEKQVYLAMLGGAGEMTPHKAFQVFSLEKAEEPEHK